MKKQHAKMELLFLYNSSDDRIAKVKSGGTLRNFCMLKFCGISTKNWRGFYVPLPKSGKLFLMTCTLLASRRGVGSTDNPSLLYRSDRKNDIGHKNNHFEYK